MSFRILYVDYEPDLREIAQMGLELEPNFEVRCCASGAEALEEARSWPPDLVLLDVMMPGMDGPQTLCCLRQALDDKLPVVFITARAGQSNTARLTALGAQGVIAKPFDPMQLAGKVRTYLPHG